MLLPASSTVWSSYLRWMFATLVLLVFCTGLFNALIDPLGVFDSPKIEALNLIKPYLDHHRELSRYRRAGRLCAAVGIFGNSRAEIGLDPVGPAFKAHDMTAFNHAIPGTGASTAYSQITWLQASNCLPKKIFLGVEFFDFLGGDARRPLPTLQTHPAPKVDPQFLAEAVFSIAGLRDSVTTILSQWNSYPTTSTEHGFNPMFNYVPEVAQSGHYLLFRQRAEENIRTWARKAMRLRPEVGSVSDDESNVEAILSKLSQSGGTTYIIIYPYHAQIRLIIDRLGMSRLFEDWKRLMVAIAERGGKVEVWDFSGVSPETLEAIPEKGDRHTTLRYYWEAGHFKKELGDIVIARLLGEPSEFGVKLDSSNIEQWLAEDRARVRSLLARPSPLTREVDNLLERRKR